MPVLTSQSWVGLAKESTEGTAVNPTLYVPVMAPKPVDVIQYDMDDSLDNNVSKVRAAYQGIRDSTFDYDCYMYPEVIGMHLVSAGWLDTVATSRTVADGATTNTSAVVTSATAAFTEGDVGGAITGAGIPANTTILSRQSATSITMSANATATAAGVSITVGTASRYRHRFAIPAAGTAPTPVTITDYDAYENRQYPGCKIDQLDLTLDAKAIAKMVAKWKGWPSAATGAGTPTFPTSLALQGWETTASIGGVNVPRVVSAGYTIKRTVEPIHVMNGSQSPTTVFSTEAEAQIKIKTILEDDTEYNHLAANDQPSITLTLAHAGGVKFSIVCNKGAWKNAPIDRSGKYVQLDADIECIQNATDVGPIAFVLDNTVATPY